MKLFIKQFLKHFIIIVSLIGLGYLLLVISYSIPTEKMKKQLEESTIIFETEGVYYSPAAAKLDNWTDVRMLFIASYPDLVSPWISSLKNTTISIKGKNPAECFIEVYKNKIDDFGNWDYSRYWHGYLIFLKPLLLFFSYGQIRNILSMVQLLLLFCILVQTRNKLFIMYPIIGVWIFLNPLTTMSSLQFSSIWIITLVFFFIVLRYSQKWHRNNWNICFLVFGCFTSYFDLLTYPIVALALPLMLLLCQLDRKTISQVFVLMINYCFSWFFGYAVFWAGKWFLGSAVLKKNIIMSALNQIITRTGYSSETTNSYNYLTVIRNNFQNLAQPAIYGLMIITFLLFIYYIYLIIQNKNIIFRSDILFSFFIITLFPFCWFAFTLNHSTIHAFFTWRNFVIIYFALNCYLIQAISTGKESQQQVNMKSA